MTVQTLTPRPPSCAPHQQALPLHWRSEAAPPVQSDHRRRLGAPPHAQTELERLARRLAGAVAEVFCGVRPMSQLRPYLAPREYNRLAARVTRPGRPEGPVRSVLSVHVAPAAGQGFHDPRRPRRASRGHA